MSTRVRATSPSSLPWKDRGAVNSPPPNSPRSARDLEILRSLTRRINPRDASAHNNLGVVFYHKGLYREAIQQFEQALELEPGMQVAERNLQIAYFSTGFYEQHVSDLLARIDADPDSGDTHDQLARAYFNAGEVNGAVRELRCLLELRPQDPSLYQRLAQAELKGGDLEAAFGSLQRAAALAPDSARVHQQIGEVQYARGLPGEAKAPLEHALRLDPDSAETWRLLAFIYGDLGLEAEANAAGARARKLNPSYEGAEPNLSLDGHSAARYRELIGERTSARQLSPGVAEEGALAHYDLGLAFRQRALYDDALREFRLASDRGEDSYLVQQAHAELLLLRGEAAEAKRLYQALLQVEPGSPKLWNELGVSCHQAGDLEQAIAGYRHALELDQRYALAWNNLAVGRLHHGESDAEAAFHAALQAAGAPADVWRNLALLLQREGRREESVAAYRSALAADPQAVLAWTGYGTLLLESGDAEEARRALIRAVEIDPRLPDARYNLAFALSALGDYQGALRETKLALELNPYIPGARFKLLIDLQFDHEGLFAPELNAARRLAAGEEVATFEFDPGSLDQLLPAPPLPDVAVEWDQAPTTAHPDRALEQARAALAVGELQAAAASAQRASLAGADRTDVLLLQGEIFLRQGFSGEAVERFNSVLELISAHGTNGAIAGEHREALLGAARSLLELRRYQEAERTAKVLCEAWPGDVAALRTLAEAMARLGRPGEAVVVLERARLEVPDDVALLTQLGEAYHAAGDLDGAESALQRALSLYPSAVGARTELATMLAEEGRHEEAELQFRSALNVLPTYNAAAFGLAELYAANGYARHAVHVMVDLLTLEPYHLDGLARLAELLELEGRVADAIIAWERLQQLDPARTAPPQQLARLTGGRA